VKHNVILHDGTAGEELQRHIPGELFLAIALLLNLWGGSAFGGETTDETLRRLIQDVATAKAGDKYRAIDSLMALKLSTAGQYFLRAAYVLKGQAVPVGVYTAEAMGDCEAGLRLPGGASHESQYLLTKLDYSWWCLHDPESVGKTAELLVRKYPSASNYAAVSMAYEMSGNIDRAREALEKCYSLGKKPQTLEDLAVFYAKDHNYDKSLKTYERLFAMEPRREVARRSFLCVLYLTGRDNELKRELAISNQMFHKQMTLGFIAKCAESWEAGHVFTEGVDSIISVESKLGKEDMQDDSSKLERKYRSKQAMSHDEKFDLGQYLFLEKRYGDSVEVLTEMIKEYPDDYLPYYYRGGAYHALGRMADARSDRSRAIVLFGKSKTRSSNPN
jgi:tetratricopeptide (TPR) repeat protein